MQVSELYRRGIVLPLDDCAVESLRRYEVDDQTRVKYVPIHTDALFLELWNLGLFKEINARCGTLIDDYEEEFLNPPQLASALAVIESIQKKSTSSNLRVNDFLKELDSVARKAYSTSRPLLFVL